MDDSDCDRATSPLEESDLVTSDPAVTFESITFSDGTTISLQPTDVVVFVGPNNAGKSVALRDLEAHVQSGFQGTVVSSSTLHRAGTVEELSQYLRNHTQPKEIGGQPYYVGYNFSIPERKLAKYWSKELSGLSQFFCMSLQTEKRIVNSDPAPAINVLDDPASHPIQMLYSDVDLECRISDYFRQAFGEDLTVFRLGGNQYPLLVGRRLAPEDGEDRLSKSYSKRLLASTVPLKEQGDGMRSFASVVLHLLAPVTPSILLLDEPEAFLHPPQARLLGELISTERSSRSQLFVATHSPDVLNGLLNVAPDRLRVLRIRRDGNINHVKELDKNHAKEISSDPLMKYSSVMSGVFHERVVICEADADCLFYSLLLDLPEVHGGRKPDVLFVHGNGKDRMAALANALMELDVPVDVIADLDILQSDDVLKTLVGTLGISWTELEHSVRTIRNSIEERKPRLTSGEIKKEILKKLATIETEGEFPKDVQKEIQKMFRKASPWYEVKGAGEAAFPQGQATESFLSLKEIVKKNGLWFVPVGELEGFCKSVGGHGPKWVQQVIETRNLSTDSDLKNAREFVSELWTSRNPG